MSSERSDAAKLARQLYRDQKKVLDLIKERRPDSGFDLAVRRLFGDNPKRGKTVRIGDREFKLSKPGKNLVSFLPIQWQEGLDRTKDAWSGCENWWTGYPFIAWVEMQAGDDGVTGHLKLTAEVGPVSNHKVRKGIIEAIKAAASANGLERIQFPVGASDKGRLYSRFLRDNAIVVNDIQNAHETERKFVELVSDFEPEFELVAGVIPSFGSLAS